MRVTGINATYPRSGVAVPVSPTDASEGGIRTVKNYMMEEVLNPRPRLWYHARQHILYQFNHKSQVI
jgi:hypothetical protein